MKAPHEELTTHEPSIAGTPTLDYYNKTYARTMDFNDQKALWVFKNYESMERVRQLERELQWVKGKLVKVAVIDRVVGKKREMKYQGSANWAALMLQWLAQTKR